MRYTRKTVFSLLRNHAAERNLKTFTDADLVDFCNTPGNPGYTALRAHFPNRRSINLALGFPHVDSVTRIASIWTLEELFDFLENAVNNHLITSFTRKAVANIVDPPRTPSTSFVFGHLFSTPMLNYLFRCPGDNHPVWRRKNIAVLIRHYIHLHQLSVLTPFDLAALTASPYAPDLYQITTYFGTLDQLNAELFRVSPYEVRIRRRYWNTEQIIQSIVKYCKERGYTHLTPEEFERLGITSNQPCTRTIIIHLGSLAEVNRRIAPYLQPLDPPAAPATPDSNPNPDSISTLAHLPRLLAFIQEYELISVTYEVLDLFHVADPSHHPTSNELCELYGSPEKINLLLHLPPSAYHYYQFHYTPHGLLVRLKIYARLENWPHFSYEILKEFCSRPKFPSITTYRKHLGTDYSIIADQLGLPYVDTALLHNPPSIKMTHMLSL